MRRERFRWCGFLLILLMISTGCEGESLVRVPASDAEFSTAADYAAYDQEMRELTAGQPASLADQNTPE